MHRLWRLPGTTWSNVLCHILQVDDFVAQCFEKCVNYLNSGSEIPEMVKRNSHFHNGIIHRNIHLASQLLARNECHRESQARAAAIRDLTGTMDDCGTLKNFSLQEAKELLNFIATY